MRIGFAGTPAFAATALKAILAAGMRVVVILSQPDRPRGRGLRVELGPVSALARAAGIPLVQPARLATEAERAAVVAVPLDVLVVVAYGLILPPEILSWPTHGCINIHASLLPRWRGAAPIQRAILMGDAETGISIMRMDAGVDTGPVITQIRLPIGARDTAGVLRERLAQAGATAIVDCLTRLGREGRLETTAQADSSATYAAKIGSEESLIDWQLSAKSIDRAVRAFNPVPGARTSLDGQLLKIWDAEPGTGHFGAPGSVVRCDSRAIVVACGDGVLLVRELQLAGGKRLSAAAFLAGHRVVAGACLGHRGG
ncbi:MAG TPA: methionyl-tRNA formyltransferase [Casimicrobiaceae bacterium]|nr:methionyl-tRNA formyltransferase [Casimicrobiaceae bacterium]